MKGERERKRVREVKEKERKEVRIESGTHLCIGTGVKENADDFDCSERRA